ncbi:MAG: tryptophan 7-halogenase, partial [Burkholderiales bacterium]|nr:tryptophan 7-halogenase [Opitutaceae bacterium]
MTLPGPCIVYARPVTAPSAEMTTANSYDVLIIGGGPAGASAAIRTRSAGLSTLVVEKLAYPRFRIGESLLPAGNAFLRELGVWEKITRAGFIEKHGARFYLGSGDAEKKISFSTSLVPGLAQTYQVERARFDALLLDHARELGAEILQPATVRTLAEDPDGITATLDLPAAPADSSAKASATAEASAKEGSTLTVRARHVIDASGRDQFFPAALKSALDPARLPTKRLAIYNHFRGVPRDSGATGGDARVVRLPDGWFWIIPIDAERTSVGVVTTQAAFKAAGLSPADHFERVVRETPRLRELLAGSTPTLGYHVTADYSYYRRDLAAGRMILAGDAGGFLDPIFSSGVYLALYSAKHAAELVVRAHREDRAFVPSECRRYT